MVRSTGVTVNIIARLFSGPPGHDATVSAERRKRDDSPRLVAGVGAAAIIALAAWGASRIRHEVRKHRHAGHSTIGSSSGS
jgi:hypothetical protein